jgi:hypothetical protein
MVAPVEAAHPSSVRNAWRGSPAPGPADLPAQLGRGLVGYWRFDDGAGSAIARDRSGNRNDCRLRRLDPSGDWIAGAIGGALSFDGRGWLECPGVEPFARLGGELSVSLWLRRERTATGIRALVSRQLGSADKDVLFLGLDGLFLEFSSHQLRGVLGRPLPTAPGRWVHVAAVRADSGVTKLYVNGAEVGRRRSHGPGYGGGSTPLIIGGGINGPSPDQPANELYEGAMDELASYGRALSDAEVEALAAGTQPAGQP